MLFPEIKNEIIAKSEIIQQDLLNPSKFIKYCHDRGLSTISSKYVTELWQQGLLHADIICSDKSIDIDGLILVKEEKVGGRFVYTDNRPVPIKESWAGCFTDEPPHQQHIELLFHPFRFYVLYHIERAFTYRLSSLQYLMYEKGANTIVDLHNKEWLTHISDQKLSEKITRLNDIVTLAIFSEPYAYQKVFNSVKWSLPDTQETIQNKIDAHKISIYKAFNKLGLEEAEKIRHDLCIDVELIDTNKILHMILRMMNAKIRQELKGEIGEAMLLFSMAEFIRHGAEYSFKQELPEEDNLGFGVWMKDVKMDIYGANRLYDANSTVKQEFFRQYGADHGLRVRCYVEGETEYGALTSLLGISSKIDLVNLKGHISDKGKVLSFRDSLRSDIKNQLFSIIAIDKDVEDNVRAIRKICEDDEICGRVFYFDPDFEFGNFSINEMILILRKYALNNGADKPSLDKINIAVSKATNGKSLEKAARNSIPELADVGKGENWGGLLMDFAIKNPEYPTDHKKSGNREIIEIAKILLRFVSVNFNYSTHRKKYIVNPDDGALVERPTPQA